jgi:signal-transduction protein with cAMP-binding, CBS, and nucleotidyltransferase domain
MIKTAKTRLSRGLFLDRDIERLREHLLKFRSFMSKAPSSTSLTEFDQETEGLIAQVFGEASELLEAYEYAQLGEASTLVNLPEEAQEPGAQDLDREGLQQRKRVLESCISELESRRADTFRKRRLERLKAPHVSDFMSSEIHSLSQNAVLTQAGTLLKQHKIGSLLVDHEKHYVGILTEADICRKGVAQGLDPGKTTVKACMSSPIISIEGHEPILEAVQLMREKGIRHLAVTENNAIVGILSVADLVRYYSGVE